MDYILFLEIRIINILFISSKITLQFLKNILQKNHKNTSPYDLTNQFLSFRRQKRELLLDQQWFRPQIYQNSIILVK